MSFAVFALALVGGVLWIAVWPHLRLARLTRRTNALERRLETSERALTLLLEEDAARRANRPDRADEPGEEAREGGGPTGPWTRKTAREADPTAKVAEQDAARAAEPPTSGEIAQAARDAETQDDAAPDAAAADAGDWRVNWPGTGGAAAAPSSTAAAQSAAQPRRSLEERIGARWSVLVGGAALALGALLLVRYSIESGLIGPGMRVLAGLALGAGLLAAGERTRRRETPAVGRVSIPATLTAAGTVAIFGAVYAAHALYGFIGPATGFLLLGATGLAAMALALRHGAGLAAVGLIGSYATPVLVHSREPSPWTLVVYLVIVAAAAYGVARMRRWFALGVAALAGASLWQVLLGLDARAFGQAAALAHGLAQTGLAVAVFVRPYIGAETDAPAARSATLAPLAIAAATLIAVVVDEVGGGDMTRLVGGAALVAALAISGALTRASAPLAVAACAFAAVIAAAWPAEGRPWILDLPRWLDARPREPGSFLTFCALAAALVAAPAFAQVKRGGAGALAAAILGAAGAAAPVALLAIAYARMTGLAISGPFAIAAGALAVAFVVVATAFRRGADGDAEARLGLGFAAAGALAALALGLSAALSGGSLTAAWALAALGAAWLSIRLDLPVLRWGVAALGAAVAARLAWEPRVSGDIGATPVFNWLLIGYGLPALAFAGAARLMREREDAPLQIARGLAMALAGFLVFFELRHAMNGGDLYARAPRLAEVGLQTFSAAMFAIVLTRVGGARPPRVYQLATGLAGALAAFGAAVALAGPANPLLTDASLGEGLFFNALIPGYLLPALGATALAIVARPLAPTRTRIAAAAALALFFVYATLETRALFQGPRIGLWRGMGDAEATSYSAVWLALGLAALAYGVARRSKEARLGSAIFVLLATFKIFLYDLAGVAGAWRAFSFIGLGLVLIGIGAVYQRVLFPRPPDPKG